MTDHEQQAVTALSWVTYSPGSWDKRFARSLLEKPRNEPLSQKQQDQLWRMVYRYRGQLCRSEAGADAARLLLYPRGLTWLRLQPSGRGNTLYAHPTGAEDSAVAPPTNSEQWRSCRDPLAMLPLVRSDAALRLFACAVWRVFGERNADAWEGEREGRLQAIQHAEQYATGGRMLLLGEWVVSEADARTAATITVRECRSVRPWEQAEILRDVAAHPFQPVPRGSWLASEDVVRLARAARLDRRPDGSLDPLALMALSDALEEAGCQETLILDHLRGGEEKPLRCHSCGGSLGRWAKKSTAAMSRCLECFEPGPFWAVVCEGVPRRHWLGCWAVDLVLGGGGE